MSDKPVIAINAPAKDEMGWDYPQAVVAFYHFTEYLSRSYSADEKDPNPMYKESLETDTIAYSASFWGNASYKQRGLDPRPVFLTDENGVVLGEDGKPERVFEIDCTDPKYRALLQTNADDATRLQSVIMKHYREEVAR